MGSRREDEKNEATIRRLLKLPENKRCINCNSLGPQYVCTTFSTFVCTQCSGIHREFSHRIKSISMAKFNAAEVAALQAGGNERARQIFFKSMDPASISLPDSGSPDKLRDFIRRVYEKRLYTGDRPPNAQQEETAAELRRPDTKMERQSDLRSHSFDDQVGDKGTVNRRKSDFDRSSVGNRGSAKNLGGLQGVPRPTRHSYDESYEEQSPKSNSDRDRRNLSRPFSFKDFDITPPPVQSITDILGNIPGLRVEVIKPSKGENSPDHSKGSAVDARKALQSQSFGAVGDDRVTPALDYKRVNSASLIDINSGTGATAVPRGFEDPFAETSQVSPTTGPSWATFNTSPTPPAPPGYPSSTSETSQLVESGWGQQTNSLDSWSSFGSPSPSQAALKQEHVVSHSTSDATQPTRQRRQLPQDFFAPSFEDVRSSNLDMHRPHQMRPAFHAPQLDAPLEAFYATPPSSSVQTQGPVQFQFPPQMQSPDPSQQTPTQRSRNPFDDDFEDDSSASVTSSVDAGFSFQFPNMDSLLGALPPPTGGVSTTEAVPPSFPQTIPTNAATHDWAHSFSQFHDHSFPPGSLNFGSDQSTSPSPVFSTQSNVSGGYISTQPLGQDGPYPNNQFFSQNVVRPAGGVNPFV
ncbi:uncharacterized protein [Physcomitrium patens]|uniref:Arf-GAP domain-containing protein n=1 Tax=Physcomitrium patens TaxID=3218 RepID=A0A2K1JIZ2_PHYPA|nr:probable ADP-ribosylation factor GTPase-activating protein AGD14 [Physcomitrium patens]XP_024395145.1 probable ADP-ribosylation factor GTPase-activating protein AGD14 [Physcomitrium patens]XP_024395146.1 probable ADP-ribosylation factor GTPase-activating protein AGD14 [Physcomitrium patens]XP_024395147.1 probable ADP-ribosylation factor GTPase-activating protein AGD14 [Physcomitrium patens]XP_024395148.1 probable ADP-ribosylation factor GTPase-activating protein AGD14 [Physcomitrium patens]|eukprot:XP_024395143.1 probable ADP-ribosylation factor GTPase-activating protein AGD14 [Physcomitrella patens]